jgi:hypothetical protein
MPTCSGLGRRPPGRSNCVEIGRPAGHRGDATTFEAHRRRAADFDIDLLQVVFGATLSLTGAPSAAVGDRVRTGVALDEPDGGVPDPTDRSIRHVWRRRPDTPTRPDHDPSAI